MGLKYTYPLTLSHCLAAHTTHTHTHAGGRGAGRPAGSAGGGQGSHPPVRAPRRPPPPAAAAAAAAGRRSLYRCAAVGGLEWGQGGGRPGVAILANVGNYGVKLDGRQDLGWQSGWHVPFSR